MKKYVVTVGRQFGSMGRPIAKKAAEMLGIGYYDRDIVEEVAKRMKMPLAQISHEEEDATNRFGRFGRMLFPQGSGNPALQDEIFDVQRAVIRDFADRGPCILVGRCADKILEDKLNIFKVYIYAPKKDRIRNCEIYFNMSSKEALKMCDKVDEARANYHKTYAGYLPMDREHMDLMINSAVFGIDGTAMLLKNVIEERFEKDNGSLL